MREIITDIFDIVKESFVLTLVFVFLLILVSFNFFALLNLVSENEFIIHDCTVVDKFKREGRYSTDYVLVVSIPGGTACEINDTYAFYNYEIGESISIKKITYKFPKSLVKGYEINYKGDVIDEN